jgi:hypothetical protein
MDSWYLMMRSAESGDWAAVFNYLVQGVNINSQDDDGDNLLQFAIEQNRLDIAERLIKQGHKVNLRRSDGSTPLFFAQSAEAVRLLANYRAYPWIKAGTSFALTDFLSRNRVEAAQEFLARWGYPQRHPLKGFAKSLLENGQFMMFQVYTGQAVTQEEQAQLRDHHLRYYEEKKWRKLVNAILKRCVFPQPITPVSAVS